MYIAFHIFILFDEKSLVDSITIEKKLQAVSTND